MKEKKQAELAEKINDRSVLRKKLRTKKGQEKAEIIQSEITDLTKKIGKLRKEVVLCEHILERSQVMKEKLQTVKKERLQGKEETVHEYRRRSSRPDCKNEPERS